MAITVHMPSWGMTMTKGKIAKWLKQEGDPVQKGAVLLEVETEKIVNQLEALGSGILFQIVVHEGETAEVGAVLGLIAEDGESPARIDAEGTAASDAIVESDAVSEGKAPATKKTFVKATPAARRLAKERGIDIAGIQGSGPGGRVTEADVNACQEESPVAHRITPLAEKIAEKNGLDATRIEGSGTLGKITKADVKMALSRSAAGHQDALARSIPYTGMREGIGRNMLESLQNAAQLTCFAEVDVTEMVRLRDTMREANAKNESIHISYNDIIIMAVSRALKHHPIMNSTHVGDKIVLFDAVNMGIAVAITDGLIVPVLKNADQKGILRIAKEARELAAKARSGALNPDEVTGGTFTISNTGMIAVDGFTPILRPPETGILGVGRVRRKPAEYQGEIALRWMMWLSLTYNHCVVDGAPAHAFLAAVGNYLQNPYLMFG